MLTLDRKDLLRNDLLFYVEPVERTVRILWMNPIRTTAAVIDVEASDALPQFLDVSTLLQDIEAGDCKLLVDDPYAVRIASEEKIPDGHKKKRDAAWEAIKDLVADEPAIYCRDRRGKLVAGCMELHGVTHRTIYRYLRRYWQRGQTPNALLPDYTNCGLVGKPRKFKRGVKLGRPVKYGSSPGTNVTPEIRRILQVGTRRYYAGNSKHDVASAYQQIIETFFCKKIINPETGRFENRPIKKMDRNRFPTLGQYRYWLNKDFNKLDIKRRRLGDKIYEKDMRGLLSTAVANVLGPGDRYEIDATIADIYLVSRLNRFLIIGRPVLYVVIDVFSRVIVGVYIGLEGPSWTSAMMALANTASDKVAFCRRFGIEIEEADWPCHFLPGTCLGDRGEIESTKIDVLINNFNVKVENAPSYRADLKAIVEQRFRLLPAKFKAFVPGYIQCDYRARGGRDYRLDAVLDLDEFTQIIIECILYYNNHHEIKKYDRDRDVLADGVPTIPIELWDWGIRNRTGAMRAFPEDLVRFSLLPVDTATVTAFGIRYRSGYYSCPRAIEERWFDRARQGKTWEVDISYDPRDLNLIYLHDKSDPKRFDICRLTDRSRAYRDLSLWEVEQQLELAKHESADRRQDQLLAGADASANIEKIVEKAKNKQGAPSTASAASRTRAIRRNRATEKASRRAEEAFTFEHPKNPSGKTAEIVPFPGSGDADYSTPDITEMTKSEEEGDE